jgi:hypothetical protein
VFLSFAGSIGLLFFFAISEFLLGCIVFAYSGQWGRRGVVRPEFQLRGKEQCSQSFRRRSCQDVVSCKGEGGCRRQCKEQAGEEGKQHRKVCISSHDLHCFAACIAFPGIILLYFGFILYTQSF